MKVFYINNENVDYLYHGRDGKKISSQQGYGLIELEERNVDIVWRLPADIDPEIPRVVSSRWGDSYQDKTALSMLSSYDIIYAANLDSIGRLAARRACKLLRKPILALTHSPLQTQTRKGRLRAWLILKGLDTLLCFTKPIADDAQKQFPQFAGKIKESFMGPEVSVFPPRRSTEPFFVASGKTARDYPLLIDAFTEIPHDCHIHVHESDISLNPEKMPVNVKLITGEHWPGVRLHPDLSGAMAAIIPVTPVGVTRNTHGISSMFDAMAVGIPIITAYNPWLSIDIEKEGVGFWYTSGEKESLKKSIHKLIQNPSLREGMGDRARALAETKYNTERFGNVLYDTLTECLRHA